jgi:hypothetical protein
MALDKIGSKELATNKTQSKAITCLNKLIDKNQHNADTHRDQQHQGQMGQDQQYDRNTAPQNLGTSLIPSLSK